MENIKSTEIKKELTPEIAELVMEKVFDIDTKGTAYSCIGTLYSLEGLGHFKSEKPKNWEELMEKVKKILHDGIIGTSL
jgi:hypothetical protein